MAETREAFNVRHPDWVISMAYYPDGRQEQIVSQMPDITYFHRSIQDEDEGSSAGALWAREGRRGLLRCV